MKRITGAHACYGYRYGYTPSRSSPGPESVSEILVRQAGATSPPSLRVSITDSNCDGIRLPRRSSTRSLVRHLLERTVLETMSNQIIVYENQVYWCRSLAASKVRLYRRDPRVCTHTLPFNNLPSPIKERLSSKTPVDGSKTTSPFDPRPPYIPFRNCRIECSSLTTFSTSPEARWS
jgi:hypothetical protein